MNSIYLKLVRNRKHLRSQTNRTMRTTPPLIEGSELFPKSFVMNILGITELAFRHGVLNGDLRQIKCKKFKGVHYYKGTDILYYYFKHRKKQNQYEKSDNC